MTISKRDAISRRIDALEKTLMPIDDSNKAALDELLDGLAAGTPKPKRDKSADPELEKLLEAYAKYKESQKTDKRDQKVVEELIL